MTPFKIVRLTTFLDFGGQEKQYISFTNCKGTSSFIYVFCSIGKGGYAEDNLREKGFDVKVFDRNPSFKNLRNILILYRWFKRIKPDLVHTAVGEANFHGIIAAKLAGIKFVVAEEVGFPNHSPKAKLLFKQLYRFANAIVCVSKAVKSYLINIGEIDPQKGIVIYNPVSHPSNVTRLPQSDFTIVTVGRLEKVKNQYLLLKSLAWIKDRSVRLILVGDGTGRQYLENEIQRLDLENQVYITGFVSEPEHFLAKANLFVLPSFSEGFGIAAVEAMQLGIPCLCSNVGGIPEFIEDGDTGWLFNPNDFSDFTTKLQLIRKMDHNLLNEVGLRGKESVLDRFSEAKYVEEIERFYRNILKID